MYAEQIKRFADENDVVLIAVSNDPEARIFDIANEHYVISSVDAELMKRFITEHNIDGVYLGTSEPVIAAACGYIAELGLPCYCTKEQWSVFQNKINFKSACIAAGLPVVPRFEIDEDDIDLPEDVFPVITKPADGFGSSSFSVCRNKDELIRGYRLAKEDSASASVIVEKFVDNRGLVVYYTMSGGEAYFSGIEKKIPVRYEKQGSYVAGIHLFESGVTAEFRRRFEDKIKKMFSDCGVTEGNIWMEVFRDGDVYYFNEAGFRYSGSITIYPIDYFYGINELASDIYFSLTGKSRLFGNFSLIPPHIPAGRHYCIYPIHLKPGKIKRIEGAKEFMEKDYAVALPFQSEEGDFIRDTGSVKQVIAYAHFVYRDEDDCRRILDDIHNTFFVYGEDGENMVQRKLDAENCDLSL